METESRLNYKQPITTRLGSKVHVYMVYKDYMNGAWYDEFEDKWIPSQWTINGFFLPPIKGKTIASNLDLINNEYYSAKEEKS